MARHINGADCEVWSPNNDKFLLCSYSCGDASDKQGCKLALICELYLFDLLEGKQIISLIGQLRCQKGIELLIEILPRLMKKQVGEVVLGEETCTTKPGCSPSWRSLPVGFR